MCCFENPDDVRGHLKSLDGWFDDIYTQKLKTSKNNKKLDPDTYYNEIWFDRVDDATQLKDIATHLKRRDYKNVPLRKVDYQELYNNLCLVMHDVCYGISHDDLDEFNYYLDKHKIEYK